MKEYLIEDIKNIHIVDILKAKFVNSLIGYMGQVYIIWKPFCQYGIMSEFSGATIS